MMPCSSGNSPTIALSRSHLARSAARRAASCEPPVLNATIRRQAHDAPGLVTKRAEPRLEGHRIQPRALRGERLPAVLLPEEGGIGQARAHHALVAGAHLGGSRLSMLLTVMNAGSSWRVASSTGK